METVDPSHGDVIYAKNVSREELYNLEFIPMDDRVKIDFGLAHMMPTDVMYVQFRLTEGVTKTDFSIRGLAVRRYR